MRLLLTNQFEYAQICNDPTLFQLLLREAGVIQCLTIQKARLILFPTLLMCNLRSLTMENSDLRDMRLPPSLEHFVVRGCVNVRFANAVPKLRTLELANNRYVSGTAVLKSSPLDSVTILGSPGIDIDFVKKIKAAQGIPGLKRLVVSQDLSTRDAYFLAFWYGMEHLEVGSFSFCLRKNELQEVTHKLALSEHFTLGDVVFELAARRISDQF